MVGQGEAVASLNFGGKDVDSEAERKIAKKSSDIFNRFVRKLEQEIAVR